MSLFYSLRICNHGLNVYHKFERFFLSPLVLLVLDDVHDEPLPGRGVDALLVELPVHHGLGIGVRSGEGDGSEINLVEEDNGSSRSRCRFRTYVSRDTK